MEFCNARIFWVKKGYYQTVSCVVLKKSLESLMIRATDKTKDLLQNHEQQLPFQLTFCPRFCFFEWSFVDLSAFPTLTAESPKYR